MQLNIDGVNTLSGNNYIAVDLRAIRFLREFSFKKRNMANPNVRLEQDLAYYQGLLQDQLREIKQNRNRQRQQVDGILQSRIPNPLENLLTLTQTRILRLYRSMPNQLNEDERSQAQRIIARLQRLRSGGCYNRSSEQERILREHNRLFSFEIPGTGVNFCIDIAGPIQNGLVNVNYGMVDIYIEPAPGERYQYPFDDAVSRAYLEHLIRLGVDPSKFPQMRFPDLEQTQVEIESLTLQLHPESIV